MIFLDLNTYYQWYENIRGSVSNYFLQYFDPDREVIFVEPVLPIKSINKLPPTIAPSKSSVYGTQALQALTKTLEQQ